MTATRKPRALAMHEALPQHHSPFRLGVAAITINDHAI